MTKTYKRPESVLIVIYTPEGDVLMLRRLTPADFWQSVTGSLEWGESAIDAARRELQEETGLTAKGLLDCEEHNTFPIYSFFRHRYAPEVSINQEHVYRLEVKRPADVRIDPSEHEEYRWMSRDEAAALATSHTNRDAILHWVPER